MHVTFLTRKFPPQKGGMETFSYELLSRYQGAKTIIHFGQKQRDIFWVLPRLFFAALLKKKITTIYHLGDAVLLPLAPLLKYCTKKKIVVTVHGLELVYKNRFLTWMIDRSFSSVDAFVCVSAHTAQILEKRGVAPKKISVITHGVPTPQPVDAKNGRKQFFEKYQLGDKKRPLLITIGRLVERKGVAWFLEEVIPLIQHLQILYVIISDGPEREKIEKMIKEKQLSSSVRLLGKIDDHSLAQAYAGGDLFIMPNISISHDVEGFGFVGIEAASYGTLVIGSAVDGIPDALHDGKNGILIQEKNAQEYQKIIEYYLTHKKEREEFAKKAKHYTLENFQWDDAIASYQKLFNDLVS